MLNELVSENSFVIRQRKEMIEILGFESRNKFEILTANGTLIGFAAEQKQGILGALFRQILGHWRKFDICIFDSNRMLKFKAHHPFRFYFKKLEVMDASGKLIGYMERQFSIFSKKFRVCDAQGKVTSQMYSGLFKIWTFPFKKDGREVAKISKKWAGAVTEIFLDSDNFLLEIVDKSITPDQRAVLLCASVFIDLLFFENNQARGINAIDLIPGVDT